MYLDENLIGFSTTHPNGNASDFRCLNQQDACLIFQVMRSREIIVPYTISYPASMTKESASWYPITVYVGAITSGDRLGAGILSVAGSTVVQAFKDCRC